MMEEEKASEGEDMNFNDLTKKKDEKLELINYD